MQVKKLIWIPVFIVILFLGIAALLGLSPTFIINSPSVASGIGSKLLCSAEFVTGYSREQARRDIVQYSNILSGLSVSYDEEGGSVSASLYGLGDMRATHIPGLGCAIDYPGYASERESLRLQELEPSTAPWPAGDTVTTIEPGMQALVEDLVDEDNEEGLNTRALLVVHGGEIVAEAYAQEGHEDMPMLGWSMAKSLTAVMLGNLEMRGLLDLRLPPDFPEWAEDERAAITVENMLNMTDGLNYAEIYEPGEDATTMLFTSPSMSDYMVSLPLAAEPGSTFNYSSGTANLLARLHQRVLGGPQVAYDDYLEHIFRPLGFQDAVFEVDSSGTFVSSSYFYASARDWARLGQLMLNGGELNGHRIVTEDWVRRATSVNGSSNNQAYGFQWWLNEGNAELRFPALTREMYYASGNRRQYVMVVPALDTVIVRLGWTAGVYPTNRKFRRILETLDPERKRARP